MQLSVMLARYLHKYRKLVVLSAIALLAYLFQKKVIISMAKSSIYNLLLQSGLSPMLCEFATSQSAFETAGFTSNLYNNNKNAFGMKYAGQVNALGDKAGFAQYADYAHSVADFVAWFTRHKLTFYTMVGITDLETYVKFLHENSYFEEDQSVYLEGCKRYYKELFT